MKASSVRRRLSAAFFGVALACAPVTAASADATSPDEPPGGYDDYVALGDSFTAGPLIPQLRDDPLGCMRSTHNYPAMLAAYLDVDTYVDASCAGARTHHLRTKQRTSMGDNPPQLDALDDGTDLVTLGIGGNDFGLFTSLTQTCPPLAEKKPKGSPCKKRFWRGGTDVKLRDARKVEGHVDRALREISQRAPHADLVVVGYPRILPTEGFCPKVAPFGRGDYAWANTVQRTLNRSLRNAAQRNDATFVRMYHASRGHSVCAGGDAWINGQSVDIDRAAPYHPLRKGMRGIARQTYRTITGDKPPDVPALGHLGNTVSPAELRAFPNVMRELTAATSDARPTGTLVPILPSFPVAPW